MTSLLTRFIALLLVTSLCAAPAYAKDNTNEKKPTTTASNDTKTAPKEERKLPSIPIREFGYRGF